MTELLKSALPIEFENQNLGRFTQFKHDFDKWIHRDGSVKGISHPSYLVSGITDAFNQLYGLYNKIGIVPGEYGYHQLVIPERVTYDLKSADCIVISHPFSGDGMSSHDKLKEIDLLNKPIFVDCAFFGSCHNIDFDFSAYKNVHSVCFSLSKCFGTGYHRIGLLYTIDNFPATLYSDWKYPLVSSAEYHYDLINKRSSDYIVTKYLDQQLEICNKLQLVPSNTIMFGLDYSNRYKGFKRGDSNINRVCISLLFKK